MFLFQAIISVNQPTLEQSIVSFFTTSAFVAKVFYFLKIILMVYTVILIVAIILVVINARPKKMIKEVQEDIESILAKEGKAAKGFAPGGDRWTEILKMVEAGEESSWRLAVIEADKFFDEIMRRLGYSGENFGDRLKQMHPTEVSNLNDIWDAHRIRNSLSHDVNFKLSREEARKAVGAYGTAMKDLDVM